VLIYCLDKGVIIAARGHQLQVVLCADEPAHTFANKVIVLRKNDPQHVPKVTADR
jgi:hypothetical protein